MLVRKRRGEQPVTDRVVFVNGPYAGLHAELTRSPKFVEVEADLYERIDDPDTHESLGGYALLNR